MSKAMRVLMLTGFVAFAVLQSVGCQKANDSVLANERVDDIVVADDKPILADEAIVANRDFAVNLYQQLAREHAGKNLFFSPYSVFGAMAIAVEGARGSTAAEMGSVLKFPESVECLPESGRRVGGGAEVFPWEMSSIHSGMSALNQRFSTKPVSEQMKDQIATLRKNLEDADQQVFKLRHAEKYREAHQAYLKATKVADELNRVLTQVDQYEIRVANALWGEKTYPFEPSFLETVQKFYGNVVFSVDFKHNSESGRQQINTWVADQTHQRILSLIPPGGVDDFTRLVLTNAIYFKGEWQDPFLEKSTQKDHFTIGDGTKVQVQLMSEYAKRNVQYAAFNADGSVFNTPIEVPAGKEPDPKLVYPGKDGYCMLEVPYKGGSLSMVVILPQDNNGLEALEQKLRGEALQTWISKRQSRLVHVFLPKFKLETDYSLKPTLIAMGMSRAFNKPSTDDGAQFDGMCASQDPEQRLYITEVLHKACVEVSEKGTEAAASTAILMTVEAGFEEPPVTVPFIPTFRADKPFLFLIRDIRTGTVLFLGRMVRPQE